jgi:DNA-binding transcriptional LysR family regulator
MDTVDGMRTFVAVAKEGSFTAAASSLDMSTALASKYVGQLETRLGTRLFNRTTRSISLTEAGAAYLERAQQILDDLDALEGSLGDNATEPSGTLIVSAPVTFGEMYLADMIAEFLDQHPKLSIDLRLTDRFVSLVDEGIDVAIRIGNLADSSNIARRLAPARIITCASPAYLAANGAPQTPADLSDHHCLIDRNFRNGAAWLFGKGDQAQTVKVEGRIITNGAAAIRNLLVAGQGIARVPSYAVGEDIKHGRLRTVLANHETEPLGLHAVYPHSRYLAAKVRSFVDFAALKFQSPSWDDFED